MAMNVVVKTEPTVEPCTTAELKAFARIDTSDDDTLVALLIKAARRQAEAFTGRAFVNTTFYAYFYFDNQTTAVDDFTLQWLRDTTVNRGMIYLPRSPLSSVTEINTYDHDGKETLWASTNYKVVTTTTPGCIYLADAGSFPSDMRAISAMRVEFIAGYGAAASSVPDDIVQAIKLMATTYYEHREEFVTGTIAQPTPLAARLLLQPYKVVHLW
ncbi:MAG TPA: head-tail connector protein [Candidatus Latescibacteria bacterium]|nr:head-tail connector protein [Candidatus Latescibacterota bacterium]